MRSTKRLRSVRLAAGVLVFVIVLGGLIWGLRGRGLRVALLSKIEAVVSTAKAVADSSGVTANGDFTNVIFLHHSTGANLMQQGGVREAFTSAGYRLWDHGYNDQGLVRPDGSSAGYSYNIPDDNTDPDGFGHVFSQRLYSRPVNAFSGLMQHEAIIFKSCFPVSDITSDVQLEQYKTTYLEMREVMDLHTDHIFIVVTPPPLNPASTSAEAASRARAFAEWLKSNEFLDGHANVFTFDFFDLLAEDQPTAPDYSMLKQEYRDGENSHPNGKANETIAPAFVEFAISVAEDYRMLTDSESY